MPRHHLLFTLIASAFFLTAAQAQPDSQLIFPPQDKHVHGSTIAETAEGNLIAAWFHGSGERTADDVKIQGAFRNKGESEWSPVFIMADTPDIPDCNPVLFIDKQDRLWLFWIVVHSNRWERSILKYRRADDYSGGQPAWTWQDIILLDPGEDFPDQLRAGFEELNVEESMWAEYAHQYSRMLIEAAADPIKREAGWMTRTSVVTLPSGRIVVPLYSDGFNACVMAYSDDSGNTWMCSKPIVGLGPIQPTIAQKKNGELVAYCRDSGDAPFRVLESTSKDNGETWSVARDTEIPNPGSSLAVVTLRDDRWVMILNDTEDGRHQLAAAISEDEGKTWPSKRYLDRAEPGESSFGYPSAIEGQDGNIHVTYSYRVSSGAAIKYTSFDPNWIAEKD